MRPLDIIDECVSINHKLKKKSLRMRASPAKYVGKYPVLHTPQADFLDDEVIATGAAKHSIIKPGTPQSRGKNATCFEHLPPDVASSISSRPTTPGSSSGFAPLSPGQGAVIPVTPMGPPAKGVSFQSNPKILKKTVTMNTNDDDIEARRVVRAVENELKHWWKTKPLNVRNNKFERGYFADTLSENYVFERLDALAKTPVTTTTRSDVMKLIEDFENAGHIPYRISGDPHHQEATAPVTNYAIEKAKREEEQRLLDIEMRLKAEEERKQALVDKKAREKSQRKQQYEAYLRGLQDS